MRYKKNQWGALSDLVHTPLSAIARKKMQYTDTQIQEIKKFIMDEIETRECEWFSGFEVNPKEQRDVKLSLEELRIIFYALFEL